MGETTGVNVLNGRKRGHDDLFRCPHYTLEALAAGDGASTVPYSDAAAQDAFYNSSVKGPHSGSMDSGFFQFVEEVEMLLGCTDQ